MLTVFLIIKEGTQPTRMHLPRTPWAEHCLRRLAELEFIVLPTTTPSDPDLRDEAEDQRVADLLTLIGV